MAHPIPLQLMPEDTLLFLAADEVDSPVYHGHVNQEEEVQIFPMSHGHVNSDDQLSRGHVPIFLWAQWNGSSAAMQLNTDGKAVANMNWQRPS